MYSQTWAQTDNADSWDPTQIAAGNTITFAAYADNVANVSGSGGAGGLIEKGGIQASVVLDNPLDDARLGNYTDTPCGDPWCRATLQIIAQNNANLQAYANWKAGGVITSNTTSATAQIEGGNTLAEIGENCDIHVSHLIMLADDQSIYVSAYANADVPFSLIGSNTANSNADENTNAEVHIYTDTNICASNQVSLTAETQSAVTNSYAEASTTGLTGNLYANAESTKNVNATVVTDSGSHITTASLVVKATKPPSTPGDYSKTAVTNAYTIVHWIDELIGTVCTWIAEVIDKIAGWLGFKHVDLVKVCHNLYQWIEQITGAVVSATTPGSPNVTNSANLNETLTISPKSCCCPDPPDDPELVIDSSGTVVAMDGITVTDGTSPLSVGETVTTGEIVVDPIVNPFVGAIEPRLPRRFDLRLLEHRLRTHLHRCDDHQRLIERPLSQRDCDLQHRGSPDLLLRGDGRRRRLDVQLRAGCGHERHHREHEPAGWEHLP